MDKWERNYLLIQKLAESEQEKLFTSVNRILNQIGYRYFDRMYVPTVAEMVELLAPFNPQIDALVWRLGVLGAADFAVKENADLRTPFASYFQNNTFADNVTVKTLEKYLEVTKFDMGLLHFQMEAHTRRMTEAMAGSAAHAIQNSIVRATTLKWDRRRSYDDLLAEFDKVKKIDPTAILPNVETVVRTTSSAIINATKWNAAGSSPVLNNLLWGFRYRAVGDSRTRISHFAQNRVTLPKDDPFWDIWTPPNGYNCRCTIIALYREVEIVRPDWAYRPDEGFANNPATLLAV